MSYTTMSITNQIQEREKVLEYLQQHVIGVLAAVDPNGDPHATTIYYNVDDTFSITFMTKRRTKKHDVLEHNNHVMLVVYEAVAQTTVQIIGEAHEIKDEVRANEVFRGTLRGALRTSESGVPPISKVDAGEYVAYEIIPHEIKMATFTQPKVGSYSELFKTLAFDPRTIH